MGFVSDSWVSTLGEPLAPINWGLSGEAVLVSAGVQALSLGVCSLTPGG